MYVCEYSVCVLVCWCVAEWVASFNVSVTPPPPSPSPRAALPTEGAPSLTYRYICKKGGAGWVGPAVGSYRNLGPGRGGLLLLCTDIERGGLGGKEGGTEGWKEWASL